MSEDSTNDAPSAPGTEWLMAFIGAGVVLGTVAFLLYQAFIVQPGLPDISLETTAIAETEYGYLVSITVSNNGGQTVAGLHIEGTLSQNGEDVETSQAALDFVPAHSKRQAGLFFKEDPRTFTLTLRVGGFQSP